MTVEANKNNDEAAIKRAIEGYAEAICAKDLDGIVSIYTPDLVSFDVVPPLQYVGAETFRNHWEEIFSSLPGPINYEIADLSITVGDKVAFTHSFIRLSATLPHWAADRELGALDRVLPEDQRPVADGA